MSNESKAWYYLGEGKRKAREDLFWKGVLVGHIDNPRHEGFNVYGKWVPAETEATRKMLAALEDGEEVELQIGSREPKWGGYVNIDSDGDIDVRFRPLN